MEVKGYPKVIVAKVKTAGKRVNFSSEEKKPLIEKGVFKGRTDVWQRNNLIFMFM